MKKVLLLGLLLMVIVVMGGCGGAKEPATKAPTTPAAASVANVASAWVINSDLMDSAVYRIDIATNKQSAKIASERKSLVGSGDRSERIRTYNFPQGRVTDHRINLTLYKLDEILVGSVDQVIEPLINEYQADQLAALAGE